jgi:hypothetical protein
LLLLAFSVLPVALVLFVFAWIRAGRGRDDDSTSDAHSGTGGASGRVTQALGTLTGGRPPLLWTAGVVFLTAALTLVAVAAVPLFNPPVPLIFLVAAAAFVPVLAASARPIASAIWPGCRRPRRRAVITAATALGTAATGCLVWAALNGVLGDGHIIFELVSSALLLIMTAAVGSSVLLSLPSDAVAAGAAKGSSAGAAGEFQSPTTSIVVDGADSGVATDRGATSADGALGYAEGELVASETTLLHSSPSLGSSAQEIPAATGKRPSAAAGVRYAAASTVRSSVPGTLPGPGVGVSAEMAAVASPQASSVFNELFYYSPAFFPVFRSYPITSMAANAASAHDLKLSSLLFVRVFFFFFLLLVWACAAAILGNPVGALSVASFVIFLAAVIVTEAIARSREAFASLLRRLTAPTVRLARTSTLAVAASRHALVEARRLLQSRRTEARLRAASADELARVAAVEIEHWGAPPGAAAVHPLGAVGARATARGRVQGIFSQYQRQVVLSGLSQSLSAEVAVASARRDAVLYAASVLHRRQHARATYLAAWADARARVGPGASVSAVRALVGRARGDAASPQAPTSAALLLLYSSLRSVAAELSSLRTLRARALAQFVFAVGHVTASRADFDRRHMARFARWLRLARFAPVPRTAPAEALLAALTVDEAAQARRWLRRWRERAAQLSEAVLEQRYIAAVRDERVQRGAAVAVTVTDDVSEADVAAAVSGEDAPVLTADAAAVAASPAVVAAAIRRRLAATLAVQSEFALGGDVDLDPPSTATAVTSGTASADPDEEVLGGTAKSDQELLAAFVSEYTAAAAEVAAAPATSAANPRAPARLPGEPFSATELSALWARVRLGVAAASDARAARRAEISFYLAFYRSFHLAITVGDTAPLARALELDPASDPAGTAAALGPLLRLSAPAAAQRVFGANILARPLSALRRLWSSGHRGAARRADIAALAADLAAPGSSAADAAATCAAELQSQDPWTDESFPPTKATLLGKLYVPPPPPGSLAAPGVGYPPQSTVAATAGGRFSAVPLDPAWARAFVPPPSVAGAPAPAAPPVYPPGLVAPTLPFAPPPPLLSPAHAPPSLAQLPPHCRVVWLRPAEYLALLPRSAFLRGTPGAKAVDARAQAAAVATALQLQLQTQEQTAGQESVSASAVAAALLLGTRVPTAAPGVPAAAAPPPPSSGTLAAAATAAGVRLPPPSATPPPRPHLAARAWRAEDIVPSPAAASGAVAAALAALVARQAETCRRAVFAPCYRACADGALGTTAAAGDISGNDDDDDGGHDEGDNDDGDGEDQGSGGADKEEQDDGAACSNGALVTASSGALTGAGTASSDTRRQSRRGMAALPHSRHRLRRGVFPAGGSAAAVAQQVAVATLAPSTLVSGVPHVRALLEAAGADAAGAGAAAGADPRDTRAVPRLPWPLPPLASEGAGLTVSTLAGAAAAARALRVIGFETELAAATAGTDRASSTADSGNERDAQHKPPQGQGQLAGVDDCLRPAAAVMALGRTLGASAVAAAAAARATADTAAPGSDAGVGAGAWWAPGGLAGAALRTVVSAEAKVRADVSAWKREVEAGLRSARADGVADADAAAGRAAAAAAAWEVADMVSAAAQAEFSRAVAAAAAKSKKKALPRAKGSTAGAAASQAAGWSHEAAAAAAAAVVRLSALSVRRLGRALAALTVSAGVGGGCADECTCIAVEIRSEAIARWRAAAAMKAAGGSGAAAVHGAAALAAESTALAAATARRSVSGGLTSIVNGHITALTLLLVSPAVPLEWRQRRALRLLYAVSARRLAAQQSSHARQVRPSKPPAYDGRAAAADSTSADPAPTAVQAVQAVQGTTGAVLAPPAWVSPHVFSLMPMPASIWVPAPSDAFAVRPTGFAPATTGARASQPTATLFEQSSLMRSLPLRPRPLARGVASLSLLSQQGYTAGAYAATPFTPLAAGVADRWLDSSDDDDDDNGSDGGRAGPGSVGSNFSANSNSSGSSNGAASAVPAFSGTTGPGSVNFSALAMLRAEWRQWVKAARAAHAAAAADDSNGVLSEDDGDSEDAENGQRDRRRARGARGSGVAQEPVALPPPPATPTEVATGLAQREGAVQRFVHEAVHAAAATLLPQSAGPAATVLPSSAAAAATTEAATAIVFAAMGAAAQARTALASADGAGLAGSVAPGGVGTTVAGGGLGTGAYCVRLWHDRQPVDVWVDDRLPFIQVISEEEALWAAWANVGSGRGAARRGPSSDTFADGMKSPEADVAGGDSSDSGSGRRGGHRFHAAATAAAAAAAEAAAGNPFTSSKSTSQGSGASGPADAGAGNGAGATGRGGAGGAAAFDFARRARSLWPSTTETPSRELDGALGSLNGFGSAWATVTGLVPAFTHARDPCDIWPAIVEKALAKLWSSHSAADEAAAAADAAAEGAAAAGLSPEETEEAILDAQAVVAVHGGYDVLEGLSPAPALDALCRSGSEKVSLDAAAALDDSASAGVAGGANAGGSSGGVSIDEAWRLLSRVVGEAGTVGGGSGGGSGGSGIALAYSTDTHAMRSRLRQMRSVPSANALTQPFMAPTPGKPAAAAPVPFRLSTASSAAELAFPLASPQPFIVLETAVFAASDADSDADHRCGAGADESTRRSAAAGAGAGVSLQRMIRLRAVGQPVFWSGTMTQAAAPHTRVASSVVAATATAFTATNSAGTNATAAAASTAAAVPIMGAFHPAAGSAAVSAVVGDSSAGDAGINPNLLTSAAGVPLPGAFWMPFQDFLIHFSDLHYVPEPTQQPSWQVCRVRSAWLSQPGPGGDPAVGFGWDFTKAPQLLLTVPSSRTLRRAVEARLCVAGAALAVADVSPSPLRRNRGAGTAGDVAIGGNVGLSLASVQSGAAAETALVALINSVSVTRSSRSHADGPNDHEDSGSAGVAGDALLLSLRSTLRASDPPGYGPGRLGVFGVPQSLEVRLFAAAAAALAVSAAARAMRGYVGSMRAVAARNASVDRLAVRSSAVPALQSRRVLNETHAAEAGLQSPAAPSASVTGGEGARKVGATSVSSETCVVYIELEQQYDPDENYSAITVFLVTPSGQRTSVPLTDASPAAQDHGAVPTRGGRRRIATVADLDTAVLPIPLGFVRARTVAGSVLVTADVEYTVVPCILSAPRPIAVDTDGDNADAPSISMAKPVLFELRASCHRDVVLRELAQNE